MNRNKRYSNFSASIRVALASIVVFLALPAGAFADAPDELKSDSPKTGLLTIQPFKLPSEGLLDEERAWLNGVLRIVKILSESASFDEALEQTAGIPHTLWSEIGESVPFDSISFKRIQDVISGQNLFGVDLISSKGSVNLTLNELCQRDLQELINNRKTIYIEPTATYWELMDVSIATFGSKETFNAYIRDDYELIDPTKPIDFERPEKSSRTWWHLSEICYNLSKVENTPLVMKRTNITSQDLKEMTQREHEEIYYTRRRCSWSDRELMREMSFDTPVPRSYFYGEDHNPKNDDDIPEITRKHVSVTWDD